MLSQEAVTAIHEQLSYAEPTIWQIPELWTLDNLRHELLNVVEPPVTAEWKANYLILCLEADKNP